MFTDLEYEIMDELYFLSSFKMLSLALPHISTSALSLGLIGLCEQGFVKCLDSPDQEIEISDVVNNTEKYWYLATKKGLQAHTSL